MERKVAANFIVGLFLARIPILLFQAVQAALLPKLAGLAGAGRHDDFRAGLRKLVMVVVGVGVIGVVAGGTLGPTVGEILFGEKFNLGHVDLALLAAGSGLFILALTLAQALIALLGHRRVLVAWCVGLVAFVGVTAVAGDDLFLRVEIGVIAGVRHRRRRDGTAAGRPDALGDPREPQSPRRSHRARTARDLVTSETPSSRPRRRAERSERVARQERTPASRVSRLAVSDETSG